MNAAYEAPCFCLYIASLKLLFICLNLFICLFITCLILKKNNFKTSKTNKYSVNQ